MKVRVIQEISSAKGVIPAGRIIDIPAELLKKLQGKVEPVEMPALPPARETRTPWISWTVMGDEPAGIPVDLPFEDADFSPKPRTCYGCKGTDYWKSAVAENHYVCRKCHPPAPGAEAA